jgi:hypothetical protein
VVVPAFEQWSHRSQVVNARRPFVVLVVPAGALLEVAADVRLARSGRASARRYLASVRSS